MNFQIFFDDVRNSLFGGKLSQGQVEGMEKDRKSTRLNSSH